MLQQQWEANTGQIMLVTESDALKILRGTPASAHQPPMAASRHDNPRCLQRVPGDPWGWAVTSDWESLEVRTTLGRTHEQLVVVPGERWD